MLTQPDDGLPPRPEPKVLHQRLESLRQSLGACRLGIARRLTPPSRVPAVRGDPGPFEVLGVVGVELDEDLIAARALPLEAFHELLLHGRPLDLRVDGPDTAWQGRLRRWRAQRILGWPLPSDRLPSVLFVALYTRAGRDPGPVRLEVARGGMEALARALAPPAWLPLAPAAATDDDEREPAPLELEGQDRHLVSVRHQLPRLAGSGLPVLIEAESGCGARWFLQTLLERSGGLSGTIAEYDAAITHELIAALAPDARPRALLLHAPSQLSLEQQLELETVLGARRTTDRGARLFTLSRTPLWPEVLSGALRQDLYWRLASLRVRLPALRERGPDLIHLFRRAWASARAERGLRSVELRVSAEARSILHRSTWPGNLEQLRREARRLVELYPNERRLQADHLSEDLLPSRSASAESLEGLLPLSEAVAAVEELMIRRALRVSEGNKADAARRLRLSRQGLYRKLRRYGMIGPVDAAASVPRRALDSVEDSA